MSFVALYRNDPNRPFTAEETAALHDFAQALVPLAELMLRGYEMKIQMLANPDGKKRYSILFDQCLRMVGFAEGTPVFLEELMAKPGGAETLVRIHDWLSGTIIPAWKGQETGPWNGTFPFGRECFRCDARMIEDEFQNFLLLVEIDALRKKDDFSFLARYGLSKQQIAVLSYLPLGYTNRQIADAIGIKEVTVKKHLHHIGAKLHALGRTEILFQAITLREECNLN
jgi:DNA-binding CsgD family transcriptional regulator